MLAAHTANEGRWEFNINVCFPFMYSWKWNCYFQTGIMMTFCLPVPTLMYLWEIHIFPGLVCLFWCREIQYVDRSWEYINRSQTHECGNWGWGRAIPRNGIHKWDFPCSAEHWNWLFLLAVACCLLIVAVVDCWYLLLSTLLIQAIVPNNDTVCQYCLWY